MKRNSPAVTNIDLYLKSYLPNQHSSASIVLSMTNRSDTKRQPLYNVRACSKQWLLRKKKRQNAQHWQQQQTCRCREPLERQARPCWLQPDRLVCEGVWPSRSQSPLTMGLYQMHASLKRTFLTTIRNVVIFLKEIKQDLERTSSNGSLHIFSASLMDLSKHFLSRRIDGGKLLARLGVHPLVVDEQVGVPYLWL